MRFADKIFFQNKGKKLTPFNRNYFFFGTVLVILVNIGLFAALGLGENWSYRLYSPEIAWEDFVPLNLLAALTSSFGHLDWSHVLMNAFAFLGCGLYLERRIGTLKLLTLTLFFAFFSAGMLAVVYNQADGGVGYSGVNYAFIGYIVLDYLISLPTERGKFQVLYGGAAVLCLVLGSFVDSAAASIAAYPVNLMYNVAHYSGLFAGVATWLFEKVIKRLA
ncbi:MAG: rhomboid family intramembrane serine protease [Clostridiales bacterium]|jgi:membrane associated rhomboid family serine protease|nr:rhomboid family intramembrane serine protease [Clostridiales bacterium]